MILPSKHRTIDQWMTTCCFCLFNATAHAATVAHEPNNSQQFAVPVLVNDEQKIYKFDYAGDEDWFVFYARKSTIYDIEIPNTSVGKGIDPALTLYDPAGEIVVASFNFNFKGEGELLSWSNVPKDGFYAIKVSNLEKTFSTEAHYALIVYKPYPEQNIEIRGKVVDQCTQRVMKNVEISPFSEPTSNEGTFLISVAPGKYALSASAEGYEPQTLEVEKRISEVPIFVPPIQFALKPKSGCKPLKPTVISDELKRRAIASYTAGNGKLLVNDVRINGGQAIAAELLEQAPGSFQLTKVTLINQQQLFSTPAFIDFDSKLVEIPYVFAFDQVFSVKLRETSPRIFQLDGLPKAVEE